MISGEHETWYRLFETTWGIAIRLVGQVSPDLDRAEPAGVVHVAAPGVVYRWQASTEWPDMHHYLCSGLRRMRDQIVAASIHDHVEIDFMDLGFGGADFQDNGLEPAVMQWASEYFEIELPEIEASYDAANNRYTFEYPDGLSELD